MRRSRGARTPAPDAELETCAPCHARRAPIAEARVPGQPFLDTHRPALLEPGLYEADGQMRDEVYEYGSFLQSPMHAAGVRCSDCHEPHSLALRAEGNAVCAQCHRAEVYDRPEHHRHARARRAPRASPATCRRAPTWRSTSATTTPSACRGPISRWSSARRTRAPTATPASRRAGRPTPSRVGSRRAAAARRTTRARSTRGGAARPAPPRRSPRSRATPRSPRSCARPRSPSCRAPAAPGRPKPYARRSPTASRSCASARSRR